VDDGLRGRPLSRRARHTQRSVETYIASGVLPRHMQRLREIEDELAFQRIRLEQAYLRLQQSSLGDAGAFERRWLRIARQWSFDHVNELIRQHNECYPIEARLPLDPRTRDYITVGGRSWRREPVGVDWVLERFPARPVP
jgi:hypothetical protein